jgi:hypothetical protein
MWVNFKSIQWIKITQKNFNMSFNKCLNIKNIGLNFLKIFENDIFLEF